VPGQGTNGACNCNYTYVENLVDAMLAAARVPEAHGNRFIINDGHTSWREFIGPLLGGLNEKIPSFTAAELHAQNRKANAFKLSALLAATVSAPQVRAVARRSRVIKWLAQLMRIENSVADIQRANDLDAAGRRNEPAAVAPPDWLASLYSPAKAVFSAKKAEDVLKGHPRIDLACALGTTLSWLEETGRLPAAAGGDHGGSR
jgi:hypothetical protein